MKHFSCIYDEKEIAKIYKNTKNLEYNSLLIQVFSGISLKSYIHNVVETLKSYFPNAKIVGVTTDGEIFNSKILNDEVVISFDFFQKSEIDVVMIEYDDLYEDGRHIASRLKDNSKLMFLYVSGLELNGDKLIKGLNSLDKKIPIIGAIAGDNAKFKKNYVFYGENISNKAILAVIINSDDLSVKLGSSFGWLKFGRRMKITKSENNIVYEIDEKPAFEVYSYYLGEEIKNFFPRIGVEFPLIKTENNFNIARAVIGFNGTDLIFGGELKEGDIVNFGIAEISKVLESSKEVFEEVLLSKTEAVYVISCMARRRFVEKLSSLELKMLKNIPNIGFFGYGEFFEDKFLNQTTNIVVLSEGGDLENKSLYYPKNDKITTIESLVHLVDVAFNEVRQKLYIDNVTHLPNKSAFDEDVLREPKSAVLFDIKKFSNINDKYGEEIGDEVLKSFSKVLKEKIPKSAKLYRISADNFIVLFFKEIDSVQFAREVIEYFYSNPLCIKINNDEYEIEIDLFASIVEDVKPKEIKIKADLALKHLKENSGRIVVYSKELKIEEKINKEIETLRFVKKAIMDDRIIPVFQKIEKEEPTYEALVRIVKENGEMVSPYFFLESIKNTRYYDELTEIMIEKTFQTFQNKPFKVSLNFSFEDIKNQKTVDFLIEMIEKYNMKDKLIIEILETESISEYEIYEEFVKKITSLGVEIAIDDFGSGYSNFVYLVNLHPHYIKIDGSLIKSLDKDEKFYKIVKSIVQFSKEMNIKVVAEFVKDKKIYQICKDLGIDGLQGYYIHEPSKVIDDNK